MSTLASPAVDSNTASGVEPIGDRHVDRQLDWWIPIVSTPRTDTELAEWAEAVGAREAQHRLMDAAERHLLVDTIRLCARQLATPDPAAPIAQEPLCPSLGMLFLTPACEYALWRIELVPGDIYADLLALDTAAVALAADADAAATTGKEGSISGTGRAPVRNHTRFQTHGVPGVLVTEFAPVTIGDQPFWSIAASAAARRHLPGLGDVTVMATNMLIEDDRVDAISDSAAAIQWLLTSPKLAELTEPAH